MKMPLLKALRDALSSFNCHARSVRLQLIHDEVLGGKSEVSIDCQHVIGGAEQLRDELVDLIGLDSWPQE